MVDLKISARYVQKNANIVMSTQWLKFIYNGQVKGSFTQATKKSELVLQFG